MKKQYDTIQIRKEKDTKKDPSVTSTKIRVTSYKALTPIKLVCRG